MFTNETLLEYYLKDLTGVDTTHDNKRKSYIPEAWNRPEMFDKYIPVDLQDANRKVWFTSDWHLNHKNIIRYSNRPYPTVELMNQCLIGNYQNVVAEDDIVFFLGDITFGNVTEVYRLLNSLPGWKIHIIGNHDMNRKGKLNGLRFDEQFPCLVLNVGQDQQLLLSHYPLTIVPEGCFSVHGHIHQHRALSNKHYNVCVENTNYTPLSLDTVLNYAQLSMELYA
jgi:calcineurin-like phosphoesterase family protein